jgi:uncharacterized protein DUF5995
MQITTTDHVLARLHEIAAGLPANDGVGAFNTVYLTTTAEIRDRMGTGYFQDDAFMERLTSVFAGRYFAAVQAASAPANPGGVDAAWRPLFEQRGNQRLHQIQYVIAGMNAHINHDLAIAVVDSCRQARTSPEAENVVVDYRRMNDVLGGIESQVRRSMLADLAPTLDTRLEPLLHVLGAWSIEKARDAAWVKALVLWQLRSVPPLYRQTCELSSTMTGMTTRHLLQPTILR